MWRVGWRVCTLFSADIAHACAKSQRCAFVERKHRAVGSKNIGAYEKGKRKRVVNCNYQQRVVNCNASDFDRRVDVSADLGAWASNADNVRGGPRKRLN